MTQHKHRIRIRILKFSREFETLSEFTGRKWSVVRYETYETVTNRYKIVYKRSNIL